MLTIGIIAVLAVFVALLIYAMVLNPGAAKGVERALGGYPAH